MRLIPDFDGVIFSLKWKEALWTSSSREHHDHARDQSSNTAITSFDRGAKPRTGHQSEDGCEVGKRPTVEDQKIGSREPRSTVLSAEDEAIIVAFRRHALLPLDNCLYALRPTIPYLTRSSLHRCLQRHGISRLLDVEGDKPKRQKFKRCPIGFFHVGIAEVRTEEGMLHLFVAIDRTSKLAVAQLVEKANRKTAREFLKLLLDAVPYRIHTILT